MMHSKLGPARLAALALGALALSSGPTPAQVVYEFADATTGPARRQGERLPRLRD
jgi:hypothetical protein